MCTLGLIMQFIYSTGIGAFEGAGIKIQRSPRIR
jgi:hypothetical protein